LRESGIAEVLRPTLQAYAEETPVRLADLEDALAVGDFGRTARVAHAMKSASGTIHAHELAASLATLEKASASGHPDVDRISATALVQARAALSQIQRFLSEDTTDA
jgi:HPt (histidine-containing phosphotransfer) domain-containing protein